LTCCPLTAAEKDVILMCELEGVGRLENLDLISIGCAYIKLA
jgi:hypothetical protein